MCIICIYVHVDEIMFSSVPSVMWVRIICVCWCLHRTNTMQCCLMSSSGWWYKFSLTCDKIRKSGGQNHIQSDTCIYMLHFLSHFRVTHQMSCGTNIRVTLLKKHIKKFHTRSKTSDSLLYWQAIIIGPCHRPLYSRILSSPSVPWFPKRSISFGFLLLYTHFLSYAMIHEWEKSEWAYFNPLCTVDHDCSEEN